MFSIEISVFCDVLGNSESNKNYGRFSSVQIVITVKWRQVIKAG